MPGRTENLHDYLIPTIGDVPPIETILVETADPLGPYGAKGVGEPALVATAPAILNGIAHATGARITRVPATPDRVLAAIRAGEKRGMTTTTPPVLAPKKRRWPPPCGRARHRHLRCLPGAVPHPPGQDRRLRPLRQCRRAARAHGPADRC